MRAILAILLAIGLAAVAAVPSNPLRIIGGSVTSIGQYPFAVSMLYSSSGSGNFWQFCGGAIINSRTIMTAAHCYFTRSGNTFVIDRPAQWRGRVGSTNANSGGVVHSVSRILIHPQYSQARQDWNNDIALLRVSSQFSMNNNVRAGQIPGSNYNLLDNQVVWAIGWGQIAAGQGQPSSEQLRHVQIWTVNQSVCRNRYSRIRAITDNMLCSGWLDVGGRDQCQGDSGGPLIHNNVIVGVCSWGQGCAESYYPGVNTRVSRYTSWIQNNA